MTVEKVVAEVSIDAVKRVYIGGMDPLIQRKEVVPFIKTLKQRGKEVTLKTSGNDPDTIRELLPYVDRFAIEIKCPLDDLRLLVLALGSGRRVGGGIPPQVEAKPGNDKRKALAHHDPCHPPLHR